MRGKSCTLVSGRYIDVESMKDAKEWKQHIARKMTIPIRFIKVSVKDEKFAAVIIDKKQVDEIQIFVYWTLDTLMGRSSRGPKCASVKGSFDVSSFMAIIQEENKLDSIFLYANNKVLKGLTFGDYDLKQFDYTMIFRQKEISLRCHHFAVPETKLTYYLECFNTDSVREIKAKFVSKFGKYFPNLLCDEMCVWLGTDSKILEDDQSILGTFHQFTTFNSRYHISEVLGCVKDVSIYVKEKNSIPIYLIVESSETFPPTKTVEKVLLVSPSSSTEDLRHEISRHIHKPPNALKLKMDGVKIPEVPHLSLVETFAAGCRIFSTLVPKTNFHVSVLHPRIGRKVQTIPMYKSDKVYQLKLTVANEVHIDPFFLQILNNGVEIKDECRLKDYHLGENDLLDVVVHENRVHIHIRSKGIRDHLVIDNNFRTTVYDIKRYMSHEYGSNISQLNIIFKDKCLDNKTFLNSAGVTSGDVLVVTKCPLDENFQIQGIFHVHVADDSGTVYPKRLATSVHGIICFFPENVDVSRLQSNQHETVIKTELLLRGIRKYKLLNEKLKVQRTSDFRSTKCRKCQYVCTCSVRVPRVMGVNPLTSCPFRDSPNTFESQHQAIIGENSQNVHACVQTTDKSTHVSKHLLSGHVNGQAVTTDVAMIRPDPSVDFADETVFTQASPVNNHSTVQCTTNCSGLPAPCLESTADPSRLVRRSVVTDEVYTPDGKLLARLATTLQTSLFGAQIRATHPLPANTLGDGYIGPFSLPLPCHSNIPQNVLQEPANVVKDYVLHKISERLGSDWKTVAINLGLELTEIQQIEYKNPKDLKNQSMDMLLIWKKRTGVAATVANLAKGLTESDLNLLAESLGENQQV